MPRRYAGMSFGPRFTILLQERNTVMKFKLPKWPLMLRSTAERQMCAERRLTNEWRDKFRSMLSECNDIVAKLKATREVAEETIARLQDDIAVLRADYKSAVEDKVQLGETKTRLEATVEELKARLERQMEEKNDWMRKQAALTQELADKQYRLEQAMKNDPPRDPKTGRFMKMSGAPCAFANAEGLPAHGDAVRARF